MRAVAVTAILVALAAGAASLAGDAAASHRSANAFLQQATAVTWSPNGKQIAFTYIPFVDRDCGCGHHVRSWIVRTSSRAGGARTEREESGKYIDSVFWAAGGQLLFSDGPYLLSLKVDGGKAKRVVAPDCQAYDDCQISGLTLSPNRAIAAVGTCDCGDRHGIALELVRLSPGRESVQRTQLEADAVRGFSPDSKQLVFSGASGLMALPLDGGNPVPLAQSGIPGASLVPSDGQKVQWSPDGRWVAYLEDDYTDYTEKLEVVPTAGTGEPRKLATCTISLGSCLDFSWSHASRLLAYAYISPTGQSTRFMTVRPDGTHLTNLLQRRRLRYVGDAQWSPDASRLVFLASRPNVQLVHVWTVRADGSHLTRRG